VIEGDLAALVSRLQATQEPIVCGLAVSRVQRTAAAAAGENAESSNSPSTARSWFPTRQSSQRSAIRLVHSSG